jgi:hypothetical protein
MSVIVVVYTHVKRGRIMLPIEVEEEIGVSKPE